MRNVLDFVDKVELGQLAGAIVLAVGMTPDVVVCVPPPESGCSMKECYDRGLERLASPVGLR